MISVREVCRGSPTGCSSQALYGSSDTRAGTVVPWGGPRRSRKPVADRPAGRCLAERVGRARRGDQGLDGHRCDLLEQPALVEQHARWLVRPAGDHHRGHREPGAAGGLQREQRRVDQAARRRRRDDKRQPQFHRKVAVEVALRQRRKQSAARGGHEQVGILGRRPGVRHQHRRLKLGARVPGGHRGRSGDVESARVQVVVAGGDIGEQGDAGLGGRPRRAGYERSRRGPGGAGRGTEGCGDFDLARLRTRSGY
jgi:hypothetical protein